jgi:hypothetical protein
MSAPRWLVVLAALALHATACSQPSGDKGGVATTGESALRVTGAAYLGPIANGETKTSLYSDPPKYRAFGFQAKGGNQISIDVTSIDGDAMAWLTDDTYATEYAFNDDAYPGTLDSHIDYTVADGDPKQDYRIVFRDYDRNDATFNVTLNITGSSPPPTCDPASEPWRDYRYTPKQCAVVRYTCPPGWRAFQNACGCGCE